MSVSGVKHYKVKAIYEKILVRPMKEEQSYGGVYMVDPSPNTKGLTLRMGEVMEVGDGGERIDGTHVTREHRVKKGDIVVYAWAGSVPVLVTIDDPTVEGGFRREEWRYVTVDHLYGTVER